MSFLEKKIPTILGLLVLMGGIVAGVILVQKKKPKVPVEKITPRKIRITNVSDNKFTISWVTNTPTKGKVIWGKVGEKLEKEALDERDVFKAKPEAYLTHYVTVNGLQPKTKYAFNIVSEGKSFDNNGSFYTVETGPVISAKPEAETIYGQIELEEGRPAEGTIVYAEIAGATPVSTLVKNSGSWTITLSTVRTTDLSKYISYDPEATMIKLLVEGGKKQSKIKVSLLNAKPTPKIVLGKNYSFLAKEETPTNSQTTTTIPEASESGNIAQKTETPKVFNIEPLAESSASGSTSFAITNPAKEGEIISSLQPEFMGRGEKGKTLTVSVTGPVSISEVVTVDEYGEWNWIPENQLKKGKYTLKISWVDEEGKEQSLERGFTISTEEILPSFEASESATTTTAEVATRSSMPSTESGVPVTGVVENTILTGLLSVILVVVGYVLWR